MKKQIVLIIILVVSYLTPNAFAQSKGWITLTQSPTSTTQVYDNAVEQLKAAGVWDFGWTYHALGAMQPSGLISIGIFPDKATLDERVEKTGVVFANNNINVPRPQAFEIYNMVRQPISASVTGNAVLIYHSVKGMSPQQYDNIVAELKTLGAFGNPAQLFHVCFSTPDGLQVVDIWNSAEAFQKFGQTLIPILIKTFGSEPPPPAVYSLYNVVAR